MEDKMSKYISNKNIFQMARDFKKYVESNKKVPFKFTYDGVEFTTNEMQDILTYALLFPKTSGVKADTYNWCKEANGDNIVEDIYIDDYLNQAQRVRNYILSKGQVPNNVQTVKSKKRVNIDLYTYCVAKILVWYTDHGNTLPNYCTYDYRALSGSPSPSPSPTSKYGHATKSGCDNMGQNNGYYCGCHSLQEVFRNLTGIVVPQSTIASWAGTTTSGTGHYGLDTAVAKFNSKYGKNLKVQWYNFSELGWDGINRIIKSNNQDCIIHNLYRNQWGHYEVVNGVSNNITVQNSLGSTCSQGCYCGYIEYRSQAEFRSYINGISQKSVMVITRS